jgi:predicted nucleic acid-binding protein
VDILNIFQGKRIYLDTNIWIYLLEGYPEFMPLLMPLFKEIDNGSLQAVTSELTVTEVLVKPCIDQNIDLQIMYQRALQSSDVLQVVPVTRQVLIDAARLRAEVNVKLPDAIHLATALLTTCEIFLSNDKRIKSVDKLDVVYLADLL